MMIKSRVPPTGDILPWSVRRRKIKRGSSYENLADRQFFEGAGGGGSRKIATVFTMHIKVANSSINSDKTRL